MQLYDIAPSWKTKQAPMRNALACSSGGFHVCSTSSSRKTRVRFDTSEQTYAITVATLAGASDARALVSKTRESCLGSPSADCCNSLQDCASEDLPDRKHITSKRAQGKAATPVNACTRGATDMCITRVASLRASTASLPSLHAPVAPRVATVRSRPMW